MAPRKTKRKLSKRHTPGTHKSKSAHRPRAPHGPDSHAGTGVGDAFEKLVAIMERLRAPNGCPWDREQTHATLRTYLIEEAYEVLDALDSYDDAKFAEELGDLLLQVLFHAQIACEEGRFSISDVINEIHGKMIRRHPHVFGEKRAKDAAEVLRNWEIIKREERQAKEDAKGVKDGKEAKGTTASSVSSTSSSFSSESLLDGIPRTLPALLEAYQLTRRAARIGFDWHDVDGIFGKLQEETSELQHALAATPVAQGESSSPGAFSTSSTSSPTSTSFSHSAIESEVGDILFVAVNLSRFLNLDPEIALKKSSAKFSRRFREMERMARAQGTTLAQLPRAQMESLWDQAKQLLTTD
ncbi:MAG: nucleoside triphosphate pyrophosphohydrolase [Candidatus Acidiferrum sp.]